MAHRCGSGRYPRQQDRYEVLTPRAAQLFVEILDRITPHPLDPGHVTRTSDGAWIPVIPTGVLRILRRPVDQSTVNSLTAELREFTNLHVAAVASLAQLDLVCKQHSLRQHIEQAVSAR